MNSYMENMVMDFLSACLVYALYTIYLLLAIVGLLTKVDMPQIGNLEIRTDFIGTNIFTAQPFGAAPGKSADWSESSFPELGRKTVSYSFRKADVGTGLVRHTFKVTIPTLKSVVTDPSGPYQPPPSVDYVSVAELTLWVHPRSTLAERDAVAATFLQTTPSLTAAVGAVLNGSTLY